MKVVTLDDDFDVELHKELMDLMRFIAEQQWKDRKSEPPGERRCIINNHLFRRIMRMTGVSEIIENEDAGQLSMDFRSHKRRKLRIPKVV